MTPRARRDGDEQRRYASGWCATGRHDRCAGAYSGTTCSCTCHSQHDEGRTR